MNFEVGFMCAIMGALVGYVLGRLIIRPISDKDRK
jgi:membrane protein DedA with SNARE-associated domain